jgi:hypothetical protein
MIASPPACYVQLGRFGDIMILLPAMKQQFDTTGVRPVIMTCAHFASVLEGCSYVKAWPVHNADWVRSVSHARDHAMRYYEKVVVPKWWDCPGMGPPPPMPEEPYTVLRHQDGRQIVIPQQEWDSYMVSQWQACGWTRQQMLDWPLVFDRRSTARELHLAGVHVPLKEPLVLYNFSGISNPMGFEPEVVSALNPLRGRFRMLDLSKVRAARIFDLLGLYDRALCLISGDTATLHLAAASKVPLIALLADGGAGSIVKGNAVSKLRYHEVRARVGEIREAIERLL